MISCKAFKFKQGKESFYLCLLKAKELLSDCDVDVYDAVDRTSGYQRRPSPERARRFSDYLTKCKGTFDSTCFINVRDSKEVSFKKEANISQGIVLGTLEINKPLFIVDGQHRLKGLEMALKEGLSREVFVPVLLTIGKGQAHEALSFLIINRTAKGIRADLTDELIYNTIGKEQLTDDLKRVLGLTMQRNIGEFALSVAKRMNEDEDSFWMGKIARPNEPKSGDRTVNQLVFKQSLSEAIKSCSVLKRAANIGEIELVIKWLKDYWRAIGKVCPRSSSTDHWRKYSLLKRLGVTVMNQLFGRILDDAGQDRNLEAIRRSLRKIPSLNDENWHTTNGRFGKQGTSYSAIRNIYTELEIELDTASVVS